MRFYPFLVTFVTILSCTFLSSCQDHQNKSKRLDALTLMSGKGECLACHSLDGKKNVGPTLKGVFNRKVKVYHQGKAQIQMITADEEYLRRSILEPQAEVVSGYPNIMKSYKNVLSKKEIETIIQYLKELK
ncbi:MAG: hypothetical protein D6785_07435 [Planctomycetota bacterium]|nr:MAG: hypothetical protein D6785_07435 [Planctomycetota bacterium]